VQEVELLRARFGGEVVYLRPAWRARARYPRQRLGLHRLAAIRRWDRRVDLHHVYAPQLFWLPLLWLVKRPVVYTVSSGVEAALASRWHPPRSCAGSAIVPSRADREALGRHGLGNAHLIRPGIDLTCFVDTPLPPGSDFILPLGPRPGTRAAWHRGVDTLLEVARWMPELRLVFRGGVPPSGCASAGRAVRPSKS
jgi:glycosyltransferase involved in cell wall biosynthesis